MSEASPPEPNQGPAQPPATPRQALARSALPFVATAVVAILVSLALQLAFLPRPPAAAVPTGAPPATRTAPPPATPSAAPAPPASSTPPPAPTIGEDGVLGLQILDLEEQNRRLWSAVYLLRAATQLDDAIVALDDNDLAEADRTLLAVYRSLDRAYAYSAEQEKGPIDTFRLELSRLRDDIRLRPEGADHRLRQLRQLMLSLVEAGA